MPTLPPSHVPQHRLGRLGHALRVPVRHPARRIAQGLILGTGCFIVGAGTVISMTLIPCEVVPHQAQVVLGQGSVGTGLPGIGLQDAPQAIHDLVDLPAFVPPQREPMPHQDPDQKTQHIHQYCQWYRGVIQLLTSLSMGVCCGHLLARLRPATHDTAPGEASP